MLFYKYLRPERSDLSRISLRITPPNQLNDPFECLPTLTMPDDPAEHLRIWEEQTQMLYKERTGHVLHGTEFASFRAQCLEGQPNWLNSCRTNSDDHTNLRYGQMLQDKISAHLGIVCLSERADSTLRWNHYAADHSGFVLGFDSTHQIFQPVDGNPSVLGSLRKVTYAKQRFALDGTDENSRDLSYFLQKSENWAYEQEWRLIMPFNWGRLVNEIVLYDIPPKALLEIVIGFKASTEAREKLCRLKETMPWLELRSARPSSTTYQMRLEPIE